MSLGFSIQDEATDVTQSAPHGAHYHAGVIYSNKEGSMGLMVIDVEPTPTRFPTNILCTPLGNTGLHPIRGMP